MSIGFMAHLFVVKLGLKFLMKIESPDPAPLPAGLARFQSSRLLGFNF
ncbi:MAG: hypothetical protein LBT62_02060 [Deltaproteobacteria bacterium]|jgi:hypothetical protein|nr:hypothetical protein [Deltaproteobacteria bacterium]